MPDAALTSGAGPAQRRADQSNIRSRDGEFPVTISGLYGQQTEHALVDRPTSRTGDRARPMNVERGDQGDAFPGTAEDSKRSPYRHRRCGRIQDQRPLPETATVTDERGDLASLSGVQSHDIRLGAMPSVP